MRSLGAALAAITRAVDAVAAEVAAAAVAGIAPSSQHKHKTGAGSVGRCRVVVVSGRRCRLQMLARLSVLTPIATPVS